MLYRNEWNSHCSVCKHVARLSNVARSVICTWYVKKSLAAKMRLLPNVCVACIFSA